MRTDIVKDLGYLTLGTRFKRLAERLQSQAQVMIEEAGIDIPAAYHPMLAALDRLGPLSVGELAQAVGVSQPAVSRTVEQLVRDGLVAAEPTGEDRRVRPISLTKQGVQLVALAKRTAWVQIEAAVKDACGQGARSLLDQVSALEEALAEAPLRRRAVVTRGKRRA